MLKNFERIKSKPEAGLSEKLKRKRSFFIFSVVLTNFFCELLQLIAKVNITITYLESMQVYEIYRSNKWLKWLDKLSVLCHSFFFRGRTN